MKSLLEKARPDDMSILWLASTAGYAGVVIIGVLPAFVGAMIESLQFSISQAGDVASANLFGIAASVFFVLALKSRFQFQHIVMACALASIILESTSIFVRNFEALVFIRFVAGFAGGSLCTVTMIWIGRLRNPDRGYGIFLFMQFALSAPLVYLVSILTDSFGVVTVFASIIVLTAAAFVIAPVFGLRYRAERSDSVSQTIGASNVANMEPKARSVVFLAGLSVVSIFAFEAACSGVWAFADRLGQTLGARFVATALFVASLAGIPGSLLVVWLGDRWGRIRPITLGVGVLVLSAIMLSYETLSATSFVVALILLGAGWGFVLPYIQAIQAKLGANGNVVATGLFFTFAGISFGPALFGRIAEQWGYFDMLMTGVVLFVLSALTIYLPARRVRESYDLSVANSYSVA